MRLNGSASRRLCASAKMCVLCNRDIKSGHVPILSPQLPDTEWAPPGGRPLLLQPKTLEPRLQCCPCLLPYFTTMMEAEVSLERPRNARKRKSMLHCHGGVHVPGSRYKDRSRLQMVSGMPRAKAQMLRRYTLHQLPAGRWQLGVQIPQPCPAHQGPAEVIMAAAFELSGLH